MSEDDEDPVMGVIQEVELKAEEARQRQAEGIVAKGTEINAKSSFR